MKEVLICGANGFIGSFLYSQLEKIFSIIAIDYNQKPIEKIITQLNFSDIYQVNRFAENCPHFSTLIFLVGLAHAKGKGKDLPEFKKINYQTLVNLLSALEENNKIPDKIIFTSTISVYGEKYYQTVYGEESEKTPFSPYAVSKLETEQYLLDNFAERSWILRFAPVYSINFNLNIQRRTKIGNLFYKVGKGDNKLSLCNIENIGETVKTILDDQVPNGIYNISDTVEYTYNNLLKIQHAKWVLPIPKILIKFVYLFGKLSGNIFLKENAVKLLTNNIFPSDKIRRHIILNYTIEDLDVSAAQ